MPRRSNNSQRGPTQPNVVKKPKFNAKALQSSVKSSTTRAVFIIIFAESCRNFVALLSCKLNFVPFCYDKVYRMSSFAYRIASHGIFTLLLLTTVHRFILIIQRSLENHSKFVVFLMGNNFLVNLSGACAYTTLILSPQETIDLLNCFITNAAFRVGNSKSLIPHSSMSFQIMMIVSACSCMPFAVAGICILWEDVGYYRILFQGYQVNKMVAVGLGVALELFTAAYQLTLGAFSGCTLLTGILVSKAFTGKLRNLDTTTIQRRYEAQKLYIHGQVFAQIFGLWVKQVFPVLIFGLSCCIVLLLYITIRHTDLPWYIYIAFPYVGITELLLLFFVSYAIVVMTRSSEVVLADLQSTAHVSLRGLPLLMKRNMLKRAKACKPYVLQIGSFAAMTLMVPVVVWEEILNQLVFLLKF